MLFASFALDGIRDGTGGVPDFQTVLLSGWTDLASLTISGVDASDAFGDYSVDNIVLESTAAPLPAALPLFATGLAALGLLGCRRKRKDAALAA